MFYGVRFIRFGEARLHDYMMHVCKLIQDELGYVIKDWMRLCFKGLDEARLYKVTCD